MPIENTSDTQCPDAGYSCLLSDCRTAVVPHLVVQHLGKMYATKPPLGSLQPCIFPAYTFPIGILDYIFLMMWATRRRLCSTKMFRASRSPARLRSRYICSSFALNGLGNEPGFPVSRKVKNRLLASKNSAADSISISPFSAILCPHGKSLYGQNLCLKPHHIVFTAW